MNSNNLSYPIGIFTPPKEITPANIQHWIADIAQLPNNVAQLVAKLSSSELHYKYRPDGWNIIQVVHHLADSHINAYTRFKLALTEDNPTIRPYDEVAWASLPDANNPDLEASLSLLKGLHARWSACLNQLSDTQLERTLYHPQRKATLSLAFALGDYAWHCRHHTAHIKQALQLKY